MSRMMEELHIQNNEQTSKRTKATQCTPDSAPRFMPSLELPYLPDPSGCLTAHNPGPRCLLPCHKTCWFLCESGRSKNLVSKLNRLAFHSEPGQTEWIPWVISSKQWLHMCESSHGAAVSSQAVSLLICEQGAESELKPPTAPNWLKGCLGNKASLWVQEVREHLTSICHMVSKVKNSDISELNTNHGGKDRNQQEHRAMY